MVHVDALVRVTPERFDDAATAFDAIGAILLAAEAAASAARAHSAAGWRGGRRRPRSARPAWSRLRGRADPRAGRGHRVDTADAPRARGRRARGAGATSRDIAEKLFVSSRTVENHLQRAYEKLGVRGRAELAEALGVTPD